jgi:hypothetical protein
MEIPRIGVKDLRRKMARGSAPVLVCGYESDDRFREMELEGAISWSAFQSRLSSYPQSQEIVFYCA